MTVQYGHYKLNIRVKCQYKDKQPRPPVKAATQIPKFILYKISIIRQKRGWIFICLIYYYFPTFCAQDTEKQAHKIFEENHTRYIW